MKTFVLLLCFVHLHEFYVRAKGLREEFTWTRISYSLHQSDNNNPNQVFTSSTTDGTISFPDSGYGRRRSRQSESASYIYQNNIPMGANRWKDKLFITVPRRRPGVPSTLNYVSLKGRGTRHNVPLIPYPNYQTNALETSHRRRHRIVSVYRVAVDPCDRLWFVDTGLIEIPGNATRLQQTSIYVLDLNTDAVILQHIFPDSVLQPSSIPANLELDVTRDTCDDAFAYIPDVSGFGLIVFSLRENRSWRVTHNYFYLEPLAGEFFVGGLNFQWNDGIFSLAVSKVGRDGYREAYFHSMAGTHLYRVSTRVLRNESLATRSYHERDFEVVGDRGDDSQTSASDLHEHSGIIFLGLVNKNALGCWNTNKEFKLRNFDVVERNNQKMVYPCDVKVYNDEVILLTNSMPVFLYSRLNYDDVNFRVWMATIDDAVEGTYCKP